MPSHPAMNIIPKTGYTSSNRPHSSRRPRSDFRPSPSSTSPHPSLFPRFHPQHPISKSPQLNPLFSLAHRDIKSLCNAPRRSVTIGLSIIDMTSRSVSAHWPMSCTCNLETLLASLGQNDTLFRCHDKVSWTGTKDGNLGVTETEYRGFSWNYNTTTLPPSPHLLHFDHDNHESRGFDCAKKRAVRKARQLPPPSISNRRLSVHSLSLPPP
ncbi:hypothetical protein B0T20DRAFT_120647 [Sordaria brevicollis]|uniref:Uncharacterized protein n=1 Tax=Sordaria brevicollis TaxID=83679 RepID=A0AAE0PKJ8_SORBR|nr:hypothetical protein B0T20DRAFT_120647 [Sordaria brevicollis]